MPKPPFLKPAESTPRPAASHQAPRAGQESLGAARRFLESKELGPGPAFSPLYRQIKDLLVRALQGGQWGPGDAIPSEQELSVQYKVSQGTVRKAIDELAAENLLVRKQGKGTFVASHAEEKTQYRFLRLTSDAGQVAGLGRRFLDCKRQRAPAEVARALSLRVGQPALQVRRILHLQGVPIVLDDLWLPADLFKGLNEQRLSEYRGPLYGLFETEFGVHMVRAEEKIRAVSADAGAAELLQVPPSTPLLSVERLSFSYGDQPVEWRRGIYNTQGYFYRNELN